MFSLKSLLKSISLILILVCIGLFAMNEVNAKVSAKKERVRMKLYFSKNDVGERMISIGLTAGSGKRMHGIQNAEVFLTSILDDSTIRLATLKTDTLGLVNLYLATEYKLPMDEDGKSVIEVNYNGNEKYRSVSKDIDISDIDLEFAFEVEDSIKYLSVIAKRIDGAGNKIPVEEMDYQYWCATTV